MACSQNVLEQSKKQQTLISKRGGKRRKLDRGIARQASMEMMPEVLQGLKFHYFQSAEEMNVVINKRLALLEQQQDMA